MAHRKFGKNFKGRSSLRAQKNRIRVLQIGESSPEVSPGTIFVGLKGDKTFLGRETARMTRELDEVTPSSIYSTLPKLTYVQIRTSSGDDDIVVVDPQGKLTRIELKMQGEPGDASVSRFPRTPRARPL